MDSLIIELFIEENQNLCKLLQTEKAILELGKRKCDLTADECRSRKKYLRQRAAYLRECGDIRKLISTNQVNTLKNASAITER